jgi:hypothetical protein
MINAVDRTFVMTKAEAIDHIETLATICARQVKQIARLRSRIARRTSMEMDWSRWLEQLAAELGKTFAMDGKEYIRQTGEECWREMFNDGLTPADAASEEAYAAASMLWQEPE